MFRRKYLDNLTRDKKWARRQPVLYAWALSNVLGIEAFILPNRIYDLKSEKSTIVTDLSIF